MYGWHPCGSSVSLPGVFAEFGPEKYDFDLYKGFFMGKTAQICQIFEIWKFQIVKILY